MTYEGIDVSGNNGVINWNKIPKAVKFAIIKAGGSNAGFYTADRFQENYDGATARGIPVGAYYYVGAGFTSAADGKADAERFIAILKGKRCAYPVFVDVEETAPKDKAGATDATLAFCERMEKAGYYVGIYSSAVSGFCDRLDVTRLGKYDKWVADYRQSTINAGKTTIECGMWQYTKKGKVSGITGNVDRDRAFKDYPAIIKAKGLNGFTATPAASSGKDTAAGKEKTPAAANSPKNGNSAAKTATYTVKRGDTLTAIAEKYGVTVQAIVALNGIANPDVIKAGQKIKIPSKAKSSELQVGDVVTFTGRWHFPASTSNAGSIARPGLATVTQIAKGTPHPVHLVRVSGKGSTVWGWCNMADIQR